MKIDHRSFTLPNGLTAIVHTDHSLPTVFVGVTYRTGSRDEPPGRTGFAHLFEHLMFQPTAHRTSEFVEAMTDAGGTDINGSTTEDRTEYHETVPSSALDLALWMESDRMGYLPGGITQRVLDEQRGVVKNEKRQNELVPGAAREELYRTSYYPPGHPYAHTVIGSMEDLDRASLADVTRWFEDHYGAGNAVLVLSGDVDFDTAKAKVTRYFGGIRPGRPVDRIERWVPGFAEPKRLTVHDAVEVANLTRSYPLPRGDDRQATLLQMVARTLGGSPRSFLARRLVDDLHLAVGVSAEVTEHQLAGSFDISVAIRPGMTPDQVGSALDEGLAAYFREGPPQERLDAVIQASEIALLRSMESNAEIGGALIDGQVDRGDPLFVTKRLDWIRQADAQAVKTVARRWLDKPYFELRLLPLPATAATATDLDRTHPPRPSPTRSEVRFPTISQAVLANGMTLVVAERPRLPVVDVRLQFATGSLAERADERGAAERAFGSLLAGTTRRSADDLTREASRIGVTIGGEAGPRQSGVGWSALTGNLDASFALAAEVVRHPAYPEAGIDEGKDTSLAGNPQAAADMLYQRALWGADHPLGRMPADAPARDAVQRFHDREMGPNDATLYLIGDISLDRARALAERHFGDWRRVALTPIGDVPPPAGGEGRVILVDAPGAAQSSIMAGEIVAPFDKDRAPAEVLADAVLASGFDSRLNTNLRQRKGWSYGFAGGIAPAAVGRRVFTVAGSVQTDRTAAGIAEIRREIADYVGANPMTQAELDRGRAAAIHALPAAFAGNAGYLASMIDSGARGLPYARAEGTIARLSAVTLDQARAAAVAAYRPAALTWVVVGDLAAIEREVRALGLGPVEVWDVQGRKLR